MFLRVMPPPPSYPTAGGRGWGGHSHSHIQGGARTWRLGLDLQIGRDPGHCPPPQHHCHPGLTRTGRPRQLGRVPCRRPAPRTLRCDGGGPPGGGRSRIASFQQSNIHPCHYDPAAPGRPGFCIRAAPSSRRMVQCAPWEGAREGVGDRGEDGFTARWMHEG